MLNMAVRDFPDIDVEIGKKHLYVSSAVLAGFLVLIFLFMFSGLGTVQINGDCYVKEKTCYGIPGENGCIGIQTQTVKVEDRASCGYVEEIKSECRSLKQDLCGTSLEQNWSQNSYTRNLKCSRWMSEYDFEVQQCR